MTMYYVGNGMYDGSKSIYHHGILGMHWGIRRFQNQDGSLTAAGRARYNVGEARGKGKSSGSSAEDKAAKRKKYIKRGLAVAGTLAAVGAGVALARNPDAVRKGLSAAKKLATSAATKGGALYRQGRDAAVKIATDAAKGGGALYRQGRDVATKLATDAARGGGALYRQGRDAAVKLATDAARGGGELYRQGRSAVTGSAKAFDTARKTGLALPSGSRFAKFDTAASAGKSLRSFVQGVGSSAKSTQAAIQSFLASAASQGKAAYQNALEAVQEYAAGTKMRAKQAYGKTLDAVERYSRRGVRKNDLPGWGATYGTTYRNIPGRYAPSHIPLFGSANNINIKRYQTNTSRIGSGKAPNYNLYNWTAFPFIDNNPNALLKRRRTSPYVYK